MNILVLTQVLPYPLDSGPKIKTLNVLKYLSARHHLILVSFVRGNQVKEADELRKICDAVYTVPMKRSAWSDGVAFIRSLMSAQPWIILRDDRMAMRKMVTEVAARHQIDAIHADQLNMAQFVVNIPGVKRVLDEHNALWLLYQRLWETLPDGPKKWLFGRDWRLLSRYEGEVCSEFDTVMAVSEEDCQAIQQLLECDRSIEVIPITVDTNEIRVVKRDAGAAHIVHVGTMYWPPNIDGIEWFLDCIYPLVEGKIPGTPFDIIGSRPPTSLVEKAGRYPAVQVHGYVEDPEPYLRQAGVFVVPLRSGGGMRVKILVALAQGLPVVTTSIGCEGIPVENGKHLLIADTPEEFAAAVLKVLAEPHLADQLGQNGRAFIETDFDFQVVLKALDHTYPTTEQTDHVYES